MPARSAAITIVPIEKHAMPLTENSFIDWIIDSFPGDKIVYYRGLLAHDRAPSGKVLDPKSRVELNAVAKRVFTMAGHGLVHPVQKRIGRNDFLYIAVKTKPRSSAAIRDIAPASRFPAAACEPAVAEPVLSVLAA
jgi:hypothetical protein